MLGFEDKGEEKEDLGFFLGSKLHVGYETFCDFRKFTGLRRGDSGVKFVLVN